MQINVFMNCLLDLQIDDEFIAQAAIKIKVTQSSETRQAALIVIDDCETRHVVEGRLNCPVDPTDRTFAWQMMIYALTVSFFSFSSSLWQHNNAVWTFYDNTKPEQSKTGQRSAASQTHCIAAQISGLLGDKIFDLKMSSSKKKSESRVCAR